jgi:hypothetical protein
MWRRTLATLAASVSVVALGSAGAQSADAAKTTSPWRLFRGASVDLSGTVLALGWAANRVWFVTPTKDTPILHSARLSGGSLTSSTSTPVPGGLISYPIVDGALVLNGLQKGSNRVEGQFTAELLANGGAAEPSPLSDDLVATAKTAVPKVDTVLIRGGVPVGRRTVWALEGDPACHSIGGCAAFFLACCSESGGAVDLTRFMGNRRGFFFVPPLIGRDARGRVWLAWLDRKDYPGAIRGVPRMLELDPATLAPRSQALAIPGVVADRIELACAASCRLVAQTTGGEIVSWAHGERSPTHVVTGWRPSKIAGSTPDTQLFAAGYRSGHLVVAYHGARGKTRYADASVHTEIRILRGDARGARAKVVRTLSYPYGWPPGKLYPPFLDAYVHGVFVPGGLVTLAYFRDSRSYAPSPVIYSFVPVGR